jgi:GH43 family beta-xylosidase
MKGAFSMNTFFNPLLPAPHPDPWVVVDRSRFLYCGSEDNGIYLLQAKTLFDLQSARKQTIWTAPEQGRCSRNIWAPELHHIGERWYVYFAADDGDNANHRMYALASTGDDPFGPYALLGQVADLTDRFAIDGTVLQHTDGRLYFVWSGWEGTVDGQQNLYIAELDSACPWRIKSERVQISAPEFAWETVGLPRVNEGPQVLRTRDRLFLIYSASGSWTEDYCLGMLMHDPRKSPLDPGAWQKHPLPVFAKSASAGVYGVGHASFAFDERDGSHWIIYHAMSDPHAGWPGRSARIQRFAFDHDGCPLFGRPLSLNVPIERVANQELMS